MEWIVTATKKGEKENGKDGIIPEESRMLSWHHGHFDRLGFAGNGQIRSYNVAAGDRNQRGAAFGRNQTGNRQ